MSNLMNDFVNKFKIEELKIFETDYWIWSLRPNQATLGSGVLSLKRECPVFSEVCQNELNDLYNIINVIEKSLKDTFDYNIMNYLMLMMVDKQVHYHVIPRYENNKNLFNIEWIDKGWPAVPNLNGISPDIEVLKEICSLIKNNLNYN